MQKKEVTTNEDLVVAGQRLPLIVLISTLLATWVGSGTVIGGASFVYQYGPIASLFFFAGGQSVSLFSTLLQVRQENCQNIRFRNCWN